MHIKLFASIFVVLIAVDASSALGLWRRKAAPKKETTIWEDATDALQSKVKTVDAFSNLTTKGKTTNQRVDAAGVLVAHTLGVELTDEDRAVARKTVKAIKSGNLADASSHIAAHAATLIDEDVANAGLAAHTALMNGDVGTALDHAGVVADTVLDSGYLPNAVKNRLTKGLKAVRAARKGETNEELEDYAATAENMMGVSAGTLSAVANIGRTWWSGGNVKKAIKDVGGLEMARNLRKRVEESAKAVPYVGGALSAAVSNIRVLSEVIDELQESFGHNQSQLDALLLMVEKYVKDNELLLTKEEIREFNQETVNVMHRMVAEFAVDDEEGAVIIPADDVDELAKDLTVEAPKHKKKAARRVKKTKATPPAALD